ncbi:MAG: hypothetical protein D3918_10310 [Candidatus Electrothrix sp. AX2]|nr:hypothetical protein [Candidatus Electrothrix gigas]
MLMSNKRDGRGGRKGRQNRESLYKALAGEGNPRFSPVSRGIKALGGATGCCVKAGNKGAGCCFCYNSNSGINQVRLYCLLN